MLTSVPFGKSEVQSWQHSTKHSREQMLRSRIFVKSRVYYQRSTPCDVEIKTTRNLRRSRQYFSDAGHTRAPQLHIPHEYHITAQSASNASQKHLISPICRRIPLGDTGQTIVLSDFSVLILPIHNDSNPDQCLDYSRPDQQGLLLQQSKRRFTKHLE